MKVFCLCGREIQEQDIIIEQSEFAVIVSCSCKCELKFKGKYIYIGNPLSIYKCKKELQNIIYKSDKEE